MIEQEVSVPAEALNSPSAEEYGEVFDFFKEVAVAEGSDLFSEQSDGVKTPQQKVLGQAESAFGRGDSERGWQALEGLLVDDVDVEPTSLWTDDLRVLSMKLEGLESNDADGIGADEIADFFEQYASPEVAELFSAVTESKDSAERVEDLNQLLGKIEAAMSRAAFDKDQSPQMRKKLRSVQHELFVERQTTEDSLARTFSGNTVNPPAPTQERSGESEYYAAADSFNGSTPQETAPTNSEAAKEREAARAKFDLRKLDLEPTAESVFEAKRMLNDFSDKEFSSLDSEKTDLFKAYFSKVLEATIKRAESQGNLESGGTYAGSVNTLSLPTSASRFLARTLNRTRNDGRGLSAEEASSFSSGLVEVSIRDACAKMGIDASAIEYFDRVFSDRAPTMDQYIDSRDRGRTKTKQPRR